MMKSQNFLNNIPGRAFVEISQRSFHLLDSTPRLPPCLIALATPLPTIFRQQIVLVSDTMKVNGTTMRDVPSIVAINEKV
jgi:hypothetical protein